VGRQHARARIGNVAGVIDESPLDNPALSALTGSDARFAERHGSALRYDPAVSVWVASEVPDAWQDIAELVGPGGTAVFAGAPTELPEGWNEFLRLPGFQMVGEAFEPERDPEAIRLGAEHAETMTALVDATKPGPWALRTYELGGYYGIVRDGVLAAMAGERMHPAGFTEISAVCTDPAYRGQGLATRLMRTVAAGIVDRGEVPFLHVASANEGAVRLYQALGFRVRRPIDFVGMHAPE
jgi:ribosomal protein S18 acetylase RimI-like enzyme